MKKCPLISINFFIPILIIITGLRSVNAATIENTLAPFTKTQQVQTLVPAAPHIDSTAHILIDADSGKILANKGMDERRPPASLTKVMTVYVIAKALQAGQITLDDQITISKKAWATPGSKMFVKDGQQVTLRDLLQGIIVDSGNDACVAVAEYIAGNEENFSALMNKHASELGMTNTHFIDSTGLPNNDHYSSAKDLAILSRAIINEFPEYYPWFKQKWFSFNGIKQPNRNRLLWRNPFVDGIKTGHTDSAGHALIASAKKDDMRLITVVLGAPSDAARSDGGQRLLSYGFRFYETHKLYDAKQSISNARVWKGAINQVSLGVGRPLVLTIPAGTYHNLEISTSLEKHIIAPVEENQAIGKLMVRLNGKLLANRNLIALQSVPKGGLLSRLGDSISLSISKLTQ